MKEVNLWLAKHPLKISGRLANHGLTNLVKEATRGGFIMKMASYMYSIRSSHYEDKMVSLLFYLYKVNARI